MATNPVVKTNEEEMKKKNANNSVQNDRDPNTGLSPTTPSKALDDDYYSAQAMYSEMYNKAKESGDYMGMQNANDNMNMVRNDYGLTANRADQDIANVAKQQGVDAIWVGGSSGGYYGGSSGGSSKTQNGAAVNDYSNYLQEMYEAQKRNALAQLNSAYRSNLSAIDKAKNNLGGQYQSARNQTAGASELSARNFQEFAAAAGLNSGAGGQAELARNIALQNEMSNLNAQESATLADLELQRANVDTEYNNAIAQAEAQHDYELAAALYEEKVRQNEELLKREAVIYQREQDELAATQQLQKQLANYGNAFLENGAMPSKEMLNAMGITEEDAQRYINSLSIINSLKKVDDNPVADDEPVWGSGYSTQNNNGMKGNEWAMVKNNIATNLRNGNYDNVDAYMSQVASKMSKNQYNEIVDMLTSYGYTGLKKY